jgi:hypothetical protein
MPHESGIQWPPEGDDLVTLSFSVPSDKVTPSVDDVFMRTGTDSGIRVPMTLVTESRESGYVVFQAQVPSDVAAAIIGICAQLFQPTHTEEEG